MATNSSDEVCDLFCDTCSASGKKSKASVFCPECGNDLLCVLCEQNHKAHRRTQTHKPKNVSCYGDLAEETTSKAIEQVMKEVEPNNKYTPGRPTAIMVSFESIKIIWVTPEAFKDGDRFQICYKDQASTKWNTFPDECTVSIQTVNNLKPCTQYLFKVRLINNDWEGPYSDASECIKTVKTAASTLIERSFCLSETDTMHKQYELKMKQTERDSKKKTRAFELGLQNGITAEKTIMMVGETGTGKSTMIDGIANYILAVQWEDQFRLKMVNLESEEKHNSTNQAMSQTEWVTRYTIHPISGGRLGYSLNIIDTPGFGDTRGIEQDNRIVKQIHQLFSSKPPKGVQNIDAICFLVKASDARLTTTQNYIFNSIMSIFGKDIEENICSLITFADGNEPRVLAALTASGMPFGQRFMFNNTALFTKNSNMEKSRMSRMFWDICYDSFQTFFKFLESSHTKSLQLTKDVLTERSSLENTLTAIETMLGAATNKVQELKDEIGILQFHRQTIQSNRYYKHTVSKLVTKKESFPSGEYVTNCRHCLTTCHPKCKRAKDSDKKKCWAMGKDGTCRICPGRCMWHLHANEPHRYVHVSEPVVMTRTDMEQMFKTATDKASSIEKSLQEKENELSVLYEGMDEMINEVTRITERLAEIALRPNPLSQEEYIDKMIANEISLNKPGAKERIETLNRLKNKAKVPKMYQSFRSNTDVVLPKWRETDQAKNAQWYNFFLKKKI